MNHSFRVWRLVSHAGGSSLAGRDTTAQTLTWMFYLISEHPQIQQKVPELLIGYKNCGV